MIRALAITATLMFSIAAHAEVTVAEPWSPPSKNPMMGAAYMQLTSTKDCTLVAAKSDASEHVELHDVIEDNGVFRMRKQDAITLAANTATTLAPGGMHMMLIGLNGPLNDGESYDVTLQFKGCDVKEKRVSVPISNAQWKAHVKQGGTAASSHDHHEH